MRKKGKKPGYVALLKEKSWFQSGFLFAELEEGQAVEVLRVGEFVDRNGQDVAITSEDLDAFVTNFEAGGAGQEVPIDVEHERGGAAGWITSLSRVGETLMMVPDWNEIGKELVGDKVYRYVSAMIDMAKRVIKSVSLVNFPAVKGLRAVELSEGVFGLTVVPGMVDRVVMAVRAAFGKVELADGVPGSVAIGDYLQSRIHRAFTSIADDMAAGGYFSVEERIELSKAIGEALEAFRQNVGEVGERVIKVDGTEITTYFTEGGGKEKGEQVSVLDNNRDKEAGMLTEKELAELREQLRAEVEGELREQAQAAVELREQLRAEVIADVRAAIEVELTEAAERRQGFIEFATEVCGGEGVVLTSKPEDVVELLAALPGDQVEGVQAMLRAKVVDLGEVGSTGGGNERKKLDGPYAVQLRAWQQAGQSLGEFFELNEDVLGKADGYDLSEFVVAD